MGLRVSVALLALCLASCNSGGGGGGGGIFQIISSSVDEGAVWEINREIEFQFSDAVDLDTANLTTISIRPLTPQVSSGTATTPGPVIGVFSIKSLASTDPNYNKIVVFQPACPPVTTSTGAANLTNTGGAFEPSTTNVSYPYRIEVFSSNQTSGPVVKSASGKKLVLGFTRNFTTEQAANPYVDTLPTPLAASSVTNFTDGGTVGLNTITDPVVFTIVLDQAVLPGSFTSSAVGGSFQLLYSGGLGCNTGCPTSSTTGCDPIPATYTLSNCELEGATTVTVVPLGTLPPGTAISLVMDKDLEDAGGQKNSDDVVLATATVASKASTQLDMILEEFADTTNFDATASDSFFPSAVWKDGYLQAAEPLPGLSVEPGVDVTISSVVNVDTTQTVITGVSTTDSSVVNVNVVDGVIKVHNLTVTSTGQLIATGPNALTILASGTVDLDTGGLISVRGGDSPTANPSIFSLTGASVADPGGVGQCGGGDGGAASPDNAASDAKGGDGQGAGNAPGAGGAGGESALGSSNPLPRAGGGGGGNWGHTGTTGFTCPTTTGLGDCNCVQTTAASTSNGVTPTNGKGTNINGAAGRAGTATSAVTGSLTAGGAASSAVFTDSVTGNNYFGVGATGGSAPFTVLRGEFNVDDLLGGAGGGAGGDSIPTTGGSLPPAASWDFDALDKKGGSGGGGGGVLIIRALGAVTIDGEINADGGDGGGGVASDALDRVGGGGGGGAGGAIIVMSATSVTVGSLQSTTANGILPKLHAWGGNPGAGNRPGCYQGGNSLQNATGVTNITNAGGPGGRGIIQIHGPRQGGSSAGAFVSNSLVVDGATKTINASSPNTLAAISQNSSSNIVISPPPFILAPDFGAVSVARSDYFYSGLANASNTAKPDYSFSHDGGTTGAPYTSIGTSFDNNNPALGTSVTLTASGSGATQTLASGSSSVLTVLGDNSVRVTSSGLFSVVSSNPAILQADLLTVGSTNYVIASASVVSTNVIDINTEASSGAIPSTGGTWSVKRRYYAIDTPGSSQAIPPGSSIAMNLEVRKENATCTPGTAASTYTNGDQEKYFRFRATFTIGGTLAPQSPRPRLGFVKALFEY